MRGEDLHHHTRQQDKQQAADGEQGRHQRPGQQCLFGGQAEEILNHPETGIIHVRTDAGARPRCQRNQRQIGMRVRRQ